MPGRQHRGSAPLVQGMPVPWFFSMACVVPAAVKVLDKLGADILDYSFAIC